MLPSNGRGVHLPSWQLFDGSCTICPASDRWLQQDLSAPVWVGLCKHSIVRLMGASSISCCTASTAPAFAPCNRCGAASSVLYHGAHESSWNGTCRCSTTLMITRLTALLAQQGQAKRLAPEVRHTWPLQGSKANLCQIQASHHSIPIQERKVLSPKIDQDAPQMKGRST